MKPQHVMYFTEKEEEFVSLLIDIGTRKNVAQVLVFLANIPEATSRDIERGTDLRQPEVSVAMNYLVHLGWVAVRESRAESIGRPMKIYELARPISGIMDSIETQKRKEANNKLALIAKLREYLR